MCVYTDVYIYVRVYVRMCLRIHVCIYTYTRMYKPMMHAHAFPKAAGKKILCY